MLVPPALRVNGDRRTRSALKQTALNAHHVESPCRANEMLNSAPRRHPEAPPNRGRQPFTWIRAERPCSLLPASTVVSAASIFQRFCADFLRFNSVLGRKAEFSRVTGSRNHESQQVHGTFMPLVVFVIEGPASANIQIPCHVPYQQVNGRPPTVCRRWSRIVAVTSNIEPEVLVHRAERLVDNVGNHQIHLLSWYARVTIMLRGRPADLLHRLPPNIDQQFTRSRGAARPPLRRCRPSHILCPAHAGSATTKYAHLKRALAASLKKKSPMPVKNGNLVVLSSA